MVVKNTYPRQAIPRCMILYKSPVCSKTQFPHQKCPPPKVLARIK